MFNARVFAFLAALALAACAPPPPPPPPAAAPDGWIVLREPLAYDGDTIYATVPALPPELAEISIRVLGVDTPEIRGDCEAEKAAAIEARDYVRAVLAGSTGVSLAGLDWDKWGGRVLATVHVDGEDLAAMLIERDLGRPYDGGQRQPWC